MLFCEIMYELAYITTTELIVYDLQLKCNGFGCLDHMQRLMVWWHTYHSHKFVVTLNLLLTESHVLCALHSNHKILLQVIHKYISTSFHGHVQIGLSNCCYAPAKSISLFKVVTNSIIDLRSDYSCDTAAFFCAFWQRCTVAILSYALWVCVNFESKKLVQPCHGLADCIVQLLWPWYMYCNLFQYTVGASPQFFQRQIVSYYNYTQYIYMIL